MKTIEEICKEAIQDYNNKINQFIANSLKIDIKPSFLTRLKIKFEGFTITRRNISSLEEEITIYRRGVLIAQAQFSITIKQ